jgi:hypothetical protein
VRGDTVAVCAVLVSFNWTDDGIRSRKIGKFVDASTIFQFSPRHPKRREISRRRFEGRHRAGGQD